VKPTKLQILDDEGYKYVGFCKQKLAGLETMRPKGETLKDSFYLPGDLIAQVTCADICDIITIISIGFVGFLCHPRTFDGKGWNPGGEELPNGPFAYPLVDDDHGTRGLKRTNDAWKRVNNPPENYGNLNWIGDKNKVLSWRGPSGQHFEMDSTKSYPGFTVWDYTEMAGGLEVEHYTPYRNVIYRGGKVAQDFLEGCKVLGCGLLGGKIISVVSIDYTGKENPDGGTGGFYDEVYVGKERIGFRRSSRPSVPWFFNSAGSEAVNGDTKLVITDAGDCSFSTMSSGSGTRTDKYNGTNDWGVEQSGSWLMYRDFSGLDLQGITLNVSINENTDKDASSTETTDDLTIYYSGTDNPTVTVTGPEAYGGEGAYNYAVEGNHCGIDSVEWTFPTGCGMGTVSVTVTFEGGNTASGSMQVRMPTGIWTNDGYEWGPDTSTSNSGSYTEVISGEYLYRYFKGTSMNITTAHFTTYFPTSSDPSCPGCRSVTNGGTDYSRGSGEDYTYTGTVHYSGSTSCCPGSRQGTSYDAYYKLYCIARERWVCP